MDFNFILLFLNSVFLEGDSVMVFLDFLVEVVEEVH